MTICYDCQNPPLIAIYCRNPSASTLVSSFRAFLQQIRLTSHSFRFSCPLHNSLRWCPKIPLLSLVSVLWSLTKTKQSSSFVVSNSEPGYTSFPRLAKNNNFKLAYSVFVPSALTSHSTTDNT